MHLETFSTIFISNLVFALNYVGFRTVIEIMFWLNDDEMEQAVAGNWFINLLIVVLQLNWPFRVYGAEHLPLPSQKKPKRTKMMKISD